jgi:hypothetical protein
MLLICLFSSLGSFDCKENMVRYVRWGWHFIYNSKSSSVVLYTHVPILWSLL